MNTFETTLQDTTTTLDKLRPGPFQHRFDFSRAGLAGLAQSIQIHGLLNRPIAFIDGSFFPLISGERRWRALCALALFPERMDLDWALDLVCRPDAPAVLAAEWSHILSQQAVTVRLSDPAADERTLRLLAVTDNLQQASLSPIEEGREYRSLQEKYGWSDRQTARQLGITEARVQARLRWLDLDEEIQGLVHRGELHRDRRVADALLRIEDPVIRLKQARYHSAHNSSVKTIIGACERLVERLAGPQAAEGTGCGLAPILAQANGGQPAGKRRPLPAGTLRQAAREMCQDCPLRKADTALAGIPEPAWTIVAAEADRICNCCSLRQARHMCLNCPGAILLKNIVANYTGERQ